MTRQSVAQGCIRWFALRCALVRWPAARIVMAVVSACAVGHAAAQMSQTLTFQPIADQFVGAAPTRLVAQASSGLPVGFTSLTPATCGVSGQQLTPVAVGACTVRASQPGDASVAAATPIDQTIAMRLSAGGPLFAPPVNYPVGAYPDGIVAADFNADGKLDLATVNWSEGTASILLGRGDGTFTAAGAYPVGMGPMSIVAADFNRDGKVDLAIANVLGQDVHVLLGRGDGSFSLGPITPVGLALFGLATADIDGDGKPDLAVSNGSSAGVDGWAVVVLGGDGTGAFSIRNVVPTGLNPMAVALRDVNGDGRVDLMVVETDANAVSVLLASAGGWGPAVRYPVGWRPQDVAIGDLNGDGKPDLAVVNSWTNDVSVLFNRGDGTFAPAVAYAAGDAPGALVIGDLDGDGKADLAVMNEFSDDLALLMGNGDGTFQPARRYGVLPHPMALFAADFNGDGRVDLAAATTVGNAISVLLRPAPPGVVSSLAVVAGSPQSATVNSTFATPFSVTVRDGSGRAVANAPVTFTAPASGASGKFGALSTVQVAADATGRATAPTFSANAIVGKYSVLAASGAANAAFLLDNVAAAIAPNFTSAPPPGGVYNLPYSYRVTASGTPSPTFRVIANALPPGLSLDAVTGAISGVPSATGTFAGSLAATNGAPPDASQAFAITVAGMAQTIDFAALADRALGTPPFALGARASSGLAVAFASLTPGTCTVAQATLTLVATGTCSVRASQAGNAVYAPAANVDRTFTVKPLNRAPAVSLVHPATGYTYVAPAIVPLLATASDPDGRIVKVEFYNGSALLATATASPYRYVWTNVLAGTYAVKAVAYDDAGMTSTSPVVSIVIAATGSPVSFASAIAYDTDQADNAYGVVHGDFDGDNIPDLVATGHAYASLLHGTATGVFVPGRSSWVGQAVGRAGAIRADLNGDGKLDIVTATDFNLVLALLGRGDGSFAPAITTGLASNVEGLAVADLTGDAKADVVAALADGSVALLTGNGNGTFQPSTVATGVSPVRGVAVGDLNGDGKPDLVVASPTDRSVRILLNLGAGKFGAPTTVPIASYPAYPYKVAVGDFNGDGRLDVAVTEFFSPAVTVLLGNGDGTLQPPVDYPAGPSPYAIAALDVNADGKVDLVVLNQASAGSVAILLGNGNGTFRAPVTLPVGTSPYGLAIGDLNGDGRPDIAVTDWNQNVDVVVNTTGVAARTPVFTNGPPPDAVGGPYTFKYTAAGIPTPIFSILGGVGPSFMPLSTDGVLSGRADPGVYSGTTIASNGIAPDARQPFTMHIRKHNQAITLAGTAPTATGVYLDASAPFHAPISTTALTPTVCRPSGSSALTVEFLTSGACTVRLDQAGDSEATRAPSVLVALSKAIALPPVTITAPAHRSGFTAGTSITLAAAAEPAGSQATVNRVSFLANGTVVGTATTAPYTVTWNSVAAGTYQVVARSFERTVVFGVVGERAIDSAAVTIVVAAVPDRPAVTLTSPAANARFFAPATVTFQANATGSGAPIGHVEFYNGATLLGISTATPYQFTWSNVSTGTYVVRAVAVSVTGVATASTPTTVTVDSGAPAAVAHYSFDDAWEGGGLVRDTVATHHARLHGSVARSTAGPLGAKADTCRAATFYGGTIDAEGMPVSTAAGTRTSVAFWMRWDGTDAVVLAWGRMGLAISAGNIGFTTFNNDLHGASAAALAGSWHHVVAEFVNGSPTANRLYVDGKELALAARSVGPVLTADAFVAPALHLGGRPGGAGPSFHGDLDELTVFDGALAPAHLAALSQRGHSCGALVVELLAPFPRTVEPGVPVDLWAAAATTGQMIVQLDFLANGSPIGSSSANTGFTRQWKDVAPGTYTLAAVARDSSGVIATSAPVQIIIAAPTPPKPAAIALAVPVPGATFSRASPIELVASATPGTAGIAKVEFLVNGTVAGMVTAPPYRFVWSGMAAGAFTLSTRVTEGTGATVESAGVAVVVIDPAPVSVSLTAPAKGAQFAIGQAIELVVQASAPGRSLGRVDFAADGKTLGSISFAAGTSTATARFTWTGAAVGTHTLGATLVLGDGGVVAAAPVNVTVRDLTVNLIAPSAGQVFILPAQIHLTAAPIETGGTIKRVDYYADGTLVGSTAAAPHDFTWNVSAAGAHRVWALAVDSNGLTAVGAPVTISVLAAPALNLEPSTPSSVTNDDHLSLSGTLQAPANSTVTVNGAPVHVTSDGRFFVDNVVLSPGANAIDLLVTTAEGAVVKRSIAVTSSGTASFEVRVEPQEGLAPLDFDIVITNRANVPFQRVEVLDASTGRVLTTMTALPEGSGQAHFQVPKPGVAEFEVKVFDAAQKVIYTAKRRVLARDPRELAGTAVGVYQGLIDRLRAGNVAAALNAFTGGARNKYQDVFTSLGTSLATVAGELGTIQGVTVTNNLAEIMLVRNGSAGAQAFPIYVLRSEDGIWRVDGM